MSQEMVSKRKVVAYTLSTCGWCKKTKELLGSMGVDFTHIDVDLLSAEERKKIEEEVKGYNPGLTFPTLVIDDGKRVITGYRAEEIRRYFEDGGQKG